MKKLYLALALIGTVVPFVIVVPWLLANGPAISLLFANPISSFFAADFLIAWLVLTLYLIRELKDGRTRYIWLALLGNFCIGMSFAFPMYLYLQAVSREGDIKDPI